MQEVHPKFRYAKAYDRRKKLFGIKKEGINGWYVEPFFDEISLETFFWPASNVWYKKDGAYGWYDIAKKSIVIPAKYSFPFYFNEQGLAITWKNHKAGVVDKEGRELIPFVYDEIYERLQHVSIPDEQDNMGMSKHDCVFRGFACFTNEGGEYVYDENCEPAEFEEWEQDRINQVAEYTNGEVGGMSLEALEDLIRKEYVKLIELGYDMPQQYEWTEAHQQKVIEQERRVKSLISDRRQMMNRSWVHNLENAKRIGRTNDLLMRAVSKAVKLGEKTSKSLQWMEKVPNAYLYEVDVFVHPLWQNSKSDYRYARKFKSFAKEQNRLIDEEDDIAGTHIWNIIATLGQGTKQDGMAQCFNKSSYEYHKGYWNLKEMIGDDGQTWDELIHYPAYQDVYFTMPFHHFYCDLFEYSLDDICNINDFRVNVNVRMETREQDKKES